MLWGLAFLNIIKIIISTVLGTCQYSHYKLNILHSSNKYRVVFHSLYLKKCNCLNSYFFREGRTPRLDLIWFVFI